MPEVALGGAEGGSWGSGGATQVSEIMGCAEPQGMFPGRGAGSWEPSVPRRERGSGVLPRSFSGNKHLGGGQDSSIQPGKTKPLWLGSCFWGCQNPNRPGPCAPLGLGQHWGGVWGGLGAVIALEPRKAVLESATLCV